MEKRPLFNYFSVQKCPHFAQMPFFCLWTDFTDFEICCQQVYKFVFCKKNYTNRPFFTKAGIETPTHDQYMGPESNPPPPYLPNLGPFAHNFVKNGQIANFFTQNKNMYTRWQHILKSVKSVNKQKNGICAKWGHFCTEK